MYGKYFLYINSKNYPLKYNIFSATGKASFLEKLGLAVWDNKLLIKQITIHTKMPVCKLSVHAG